MKFVNLLILFICLLYFANTGLSQCNSGNMITPYYDCSDALSDSSGISGLFCTNNSFCVNTSDAPFLNPPPLFCSANSVINNPIWIPFIAGENDSLDIEIISENCTGEGSQWAIYDTCGNYFNTIACQSNPILPGGTPFNVTAILTPGKKYLLMIDGANGTSCVYNFNILSGVKGSNVFTAIDSSLIGNPLICPTEISQFEFSGFQFANKYSWFFDGEFIAQTSTPEVNFKIPLRPEGVYQLCVNGNNLCDTTGQDLCWNLEIIRNQTLNLNETVCPGEKVYIQGVQYDQGHYIIPYEGPNTCINEIDLTVTRSQIPIDTVYGIVICPDQDFLTLNGKDYGTSEFHYDTLVSTDGCKYIAYFVIEKVINFLGHIESTADSIDCNGIDTATLKFKGLISGLNTKINETYEWYNEAGQLLSTDTSYTTNEAGKYLLKVISTFENPGLIEGVDELLKCETELEYTIYSTNYLFENPQIELEDESPSNHTYVINIINLSSFTDDTEFNWIIPPGVLFSIEDNGSLIGNFSQTGNYTFCVSATNECNSTDTSCISFEVGTISNHELSDKNIIKLKNNPVKDILIFQNENVSNEKIKFEIYNEQGHKVLSETKNVNEKYEIINCSQLIPGIYFYKINSGKKIQSTGKFIKF